MFLYLSKLLPIFVYPLGLACVLLVITLVLWWKRSRWTPLPVILALLVLLLGSNGWVSQWMVRSLEWQNLPSANLPNAEAIVVLGGATKPASPPRPMVDLNEEGDRVLYAAQLYRQGKAPLIIASGGRIDWRGGGPSEASDMAQLLEMMGVPPSNIILEPNSFNTYQNAVYVKEILQEKGIQQILLVTSAFHMPRSLKIFQKQGIDAIPAPTDFRVSQQDLQEINNTPEAMILNILPDSDRLATTTKVIKEYIGTVVYRLRGWL
ncbi:MAG: YdcF family protein [Halothece sp.]